MPITRNPEEHWQQKQKDNEEQEDSERDGSTKLKRQWKEEECTGKKINIGCTTEKTGRKQQAVHGLTASIDDWTRRKKDSTDKSVINQKN